MFETGARVLYIEPGDLRHLAIGTVTGEVYAPNIIEVKFDDIILNNSGGRGWNARTSRLLGYKTSDDTLVYIREGGTIYPYSAHARLAVIAYYEEKVERDQARARDAHQVRDGWIRAPSPFMSTMQRWEEPRAEPVSQPSESDTEVSVSSSTVPSEGDYWVTPGRNPFSTTYSPETPLSATEIRAREARRRVDRAFRVAVQRATGTSPTGRQE